MRKLNFNKIWQQLAIATNWPVLVAVLVLAGMGIISIAAANRGDAYKQCVFLGISLLCLALFQAVNYQLIGRWGWVFYILSLLLIIYTVIGTRFHVPGVHNVNGAFAWINFGSFSCEPAELMKFAFVLVL